MTNKKITSEIAVGVVLLLAIIVGAIFYLNDRDAQKETLQVMDSPQVIKKEPIVEMKNYPDESIEILSPKVGDVLELGNEYVIKWTPFLMSEDNGCYILLGGKGENGVVIGDKCSAQDKEKKDEYCFDSEKGSMKWRPTEQELSLARPSGSANESIKYRIKIEIGHYGSSGSIIGLKTEKEISSQYFGVTKGKN